MFEGVIYLCGEGTVSMEAFAPDSNTFVPLNISLPQSSHCCLYVDSDLLVVNSTSYIVKYAMGPDGQLTQQSRVESPRLDKRQNSQPVVDRAQGLYFMIQDGKCMQVDMQREVQVKA